MNLAMQQGMKIFNDAIKRRRIHVIHEVPEHTEACETIHIPTPYDYTDWNHELKAWQCQYCQRIHDTKNHQWITEDERRMQCETSL